MTVLATVSDAEIRGILNARYVDNYFEVALLNMPGEVYQPVVDNAADLISNNELPAGPGGYYRQVLTYLPSDVGTYSEQGINLATKAAVFAHDGTTTILTFTHVALIRGSGNITELSFSSSEPSAVNDGTYPNLPVTTTATGTQAKLTLTIAGGVITPTIAYAGYGYEAGSNIVVNDSVLAAAGAITGGAGDYVIGIEAVTTQDAGELVAMAQTADTVNLANGNEAVFYYNLKQFGYSA